MFRKSTLSLAIASLSAGFVAPLFAEDPALKPQAPVLEQPEEDIEELQVTGQIPDTEQDKERYDTAVSDSLSADAFSRFGDSNAAAALNRLVGVTISDGKYVVSRGLNERHSSISLNGASLPSPDPSRRVVPLDIFPSSVIKNISVQKAFTPDVYADSTGAAVKLDTKQYPASFEGKFSFSIGYKDGTTSETRDVQQAQAMDVFGFGSTGDREIPTEFKQLESNRNITLLDPGFQQRLNASFASNLGTETTTISPDMSMEFSMGDTLISDSALQVGYTSSIKYSNKWDTQEREQNTYEYTGGELVQDDFYNEVRTSNDINLGIGFSIGVDAMGDGYGSNTLILRQAHAENSVRNGVGGDQNREFYASRLGWYEREFLMQQFTGDHLFADLSNTELKWQVSYSSASLNSPDERFYSFERDADSQTSDFELYWSSTDRVYNELEDTNVDFTIDSSTFVFDGNNFGSRVLYGLNLFSRERTADGSTVLVSGPGQTASGYNGTFDIDSIIDDATESGAANISSGSLPSDDYSATWDMTAFYLTTDFEMYDEFKIAVGARAENSEMVLDTFTIGSTEFNKDPQQALVEDNDLFPSLSVIYVLNDDMQIKAGYNGTKNRPDFRELANTLYIDPDTGDAFRGNPLLESAEVTNIDLRYEYYLSTSESISVAYFAKEFTNPIEKTFKTGGDVKSFANGEKGELTGLEIDFRSEFQVSVLDGFVSGNFAQFDSEVDLKVGTDIKTQSMQGQPDQLANLQFGLDNFETGTQFTFLVNYKGESIEFVQEGLAPNVLNQPRTQIDMTFSQEIMEEITLKAQLKNLTDSPIEQTQGGKTYREYSKGMEFSLGLSMPL